MAAVVGGFLALRNVPATVAGAFCRSGNTPKTVTDGFPSPRNVTKAVAGGSKTTILVTAGCFMAILDTSGRRFHTFCRRVTAGKRAGDGVPS